MVNADRALPGGVSRLGDFPDNDHCWILLDVVQGKSRASVALPAAANADARCFSLALGARCWHNAAMEEQTGQRGAVDELAVSRAWQAGWFRAAALRTSEGQPLTVVYRGRWTFGFGPDFQGALIAFGAELRQGDVEIHLRSSGWREHGHHLNPAYNSVILHVILDAAGPVAPCVRQDGLRVPTLVLAPALRGPLADLPRNPALAAIGALAADACVATITPAQRAEALAALDRAGDARLTARAAQFEAAFTATTPGQILYAGLLDALGYARNRAPMATLAGMLPLAVLEARLPAGDPQEGFRAAAALLLGVAGFLPLTPALLALGGLTADDALAIERSWAERRAPWHGRLLTPERWTLARTRPANHPVRRLLGLAAILARAGRLGLLAATLEACGADAPAVGLAELRALLLGPPRAGDPAGRYIGQDRAAELLTNIVIPFALAYGAWAEDERLAGGASVLWERTPATGGNEATRALLARLGAGAGLRLKTGRAQQGAIHLARHFCEQRRCYECPLARLSRADLAPD